jgi:hypothetical protein
MQSTLGAAVAIELPEKTEEEVIKDYEKLKDRVDQVITKIKDRKNKKTHKNKK